MVKLGTALTPGATKVMMCGCGELGKEVVIELQRLGVEVIAVDRYANARSMPALFWACLFRIFVNSTPLRLPLFWVMAHRQISVLKMLRPP